MWNKISIVLVNSHSRNDQGFHDPNIKATLLEFRSMLSFNNFLKAFFIENVGVLPESQYDLQYISINLSKENMHQILESFGPRKICFIIEHTVNKEKKRKYYSENVDIVTIC